MCGIGSKRRQRRIGVVHRVHEVVIIGWIDRVRRRRIDRAQVAQSPQVAQFVGNRKRDLVGEVDRLEFICRLPLVVPSFEVVGEFASKRISVVLEIVSRSRLLSHAESRNQRTGPQIADVHDVGRVDCRGKTRRQTLFANARVDIRQTDNKKIPANPLVLISMAVAAAESSCNCPRAGHRCYSR